MEFLPDPQATPPKLRVDQEFATPILLKAEMVLPDYPGAALAGRAAPAHVVVRVIIDEQGRIADVLDSPVQASSQSPFAGVLKDSVLRALRHWRFTPGRIVQWEEGKDFDGDGVSDARAMVHSDPIRVFYDIRFDFEIVDGEGRVTTSASGGP